MLIKAPANIVDDFPSELEEYFERMLDMVPRRYHEPYSAIFLAVVGGGELLPLVLLAHITSSEEPAGYEYLHSSRKLRARLKAYCGDLMTVVSDDQDKFPDCVERIDFLHRTVNDYLCSPAVRTKLQCRVPANFHGALALCESSARYLRTMPKGLTIDHPVVELLLSQASKLKEEETVYDVQMVDEVREFVTAGKTTNRDFIKIALCYGLYSYINERFRDMSPFDFDATSALQYVAFEIDFHGSQKRMIPEDKQLGMIRVLLERGAHPNAPVGSASDINVGQFLKQPGQCIWSNVVDIMEGQAIRAQATRVKPKSFHRELDTEICDVFLEHGADYDATISSGLTTREALQIHFETMPKGLANFDMLVRQRRRRGMLSLNSDDPHFNQSQLLTTGSGVPPMRPRSHEPVGSGRSSNPDSEGKRGKMRTKFLSWLKDKKMAFNGGRA